MEPLFLSGGSATSCKIHPVVLFQILDHHSRRKDGQKRVIGTLLGVVSGHTVEIRNSFPVPHTELTDNVSFNSVRRILNISGGNRSRISQIDV